GGGGEPVAAGQHRQRQRRRGGEQGPSADAHQDLPSRVAGPPERGPISVCTASATRPSSAPVPAEVASAGSISHSAARPPPGPSPGITQPTTMPIAPCSTPVRVSVSTGRGMRPTPTTPIHTTAVTERIRAARSGPGPGGHGGVSGDGGEGGAGPMISSGGSGRRGGAGGGGGEAVFRGSPAPVGGPAAHRPGSGSCPPCSSTAMSPGSDT